MGFLLYSQGMLFWRTRGPSIDWPTFPLFWLILSRRRDYLGLKGCLYRTLSS